MRANDRVQLAPHLDHWMRGDRYGTIVRVTTDGKHAHVKLDKSGNTILINVPQDVYENYGQEITP